MQGRLERRRLGADAAAPAAAPGSRPLAFARACCADAALLARLAQTAALAGHSGAVTAAGWSDTGDRLASGGEDCRIKVWDPHSERAVCTFESVRAWRVPPVFSRTSRLSVPASCGAHGGNDPAKEPRAQPYTDTPMSTAVCSRQERSAKR
jgi:hypothetical protein